MMTIIVYAAVMQPTTQTGAMAAIGTPLAQTKDRWFGPDSVTMSDDVFIVFGPNISDMVTLNDDIAIDFQKAPFVDTTTMTDAVDVSIGFIRQFDDTVTMSDALLPFTVGKGIADVVSLDDIASINGQNNPNDVMTVGDQATIQFASGAKADTVSVSDSGKAIVQDYFVNGDYFADDYFGTSRTF